MALDKMRQQCGVALRELREEHHVSLLQVTGAMRVTETFVEAIESGRFDQLPGEIFGRGYIRNLCKMLRVDAEPWVELYNQCWPKSPKTAPESAANRRASTWSALSGRRLSARMKRRPRIPLLAVGFGILILLIAGYGTFFRYSSQIRRQLKSSIPQVLPETAEPQPTARAKAEPQPTVAPPAEQDPQPVPPSQNWTRLGAAETPGARFVEVRAPKGSSITYTAEDGLRMSQNLGPGLTRIFFTKRLELLFNEIHEVELVYAGRRFVLDQERHLNKPLIFLPGQEMAQREDSATSG